MLNSCFDWPTGGATALPLNVALGYLRDSEDRIKLDVPVTGNIRDPQFSFNDVIRLATQAAAQQPAMLAKQARLTAELQAQAEKAEKSGKEKPQAQQNAQEQVPSTVSDDQLPLWERVRTAIHNLGKNGSGRLLQLPPLSAWLTGCSLPLPNLVTAFAKC